MCIHIVVLGFGGFPFWRPQVPKLGTGPPPPKVDKGKLAEQHIGDYVIGLSNEERDGS